MGRDVVKMSFCAGRSYRRGDPVDIAMTEPGATRSDSNDVEWECVYAEASNRSSNHFHHGPEEVTAVATPGGLLLLLRRPGGIGPSLTIFCSIFASIVLSCLEAAGGEGEGDAL